MDFAALQIGYSKCLGDSLEASGTISLLRSAKFHAVIDTGSPWDRDGLLEKLAQKKVNPLQIDWVFGTHGHIDHIGNINLFQESKMIVGCDIATKNVYENFDLRSNDYRVC